MRFSAFCEHFPFVGKFREPLIIPFVAFATGVFVSSYARMDWAELVLAFALFALAGIVSRLRAPRCAWIAWACCISVAGSAVAEFHRRGPAPEMEADSGEMLMVSGCVVEPLSIQDDRGRFAVELEPGARVFVSFRLDVDKPQPPVAFGTMVEFPARVRKPRNYGNPGAFDYVRYLARRNIYWLATVQTHAEIRTLSAPCGSAWDAKINQLRQAALSRIDWLYPADARGFMRALLLGEDDHLDRNTSDEFRKTGTYHAIVISGLHISLVAGSVLWLLRRVFAPLWLRLFLSAITAWIYTVMAGGGAPVLRAAIGFTLALMAAAVFRRVRVLNILAAVALGFLIYDPDQLFEPSFQLSFAAVAAIGALAAPVLDRTSSVLREASRNIDRVRPSPLIKPRVSSLRIELRLLAHTIAVVTNTRRGVATKVVSFTSGMIAVWVETILLSACIQFALTVPAILYFHRVPVTGVAANLLAIPFLNLAVGFGLSGLVIGSVTLSSIAARLVESAEAVVAWFARLEPAWRVATPPLWLVVSFTTALILLSFTLRRNAKLAALPALLSLSLAGAMYVYDSGTGQSGWLEVSTIDVAQGDSLFVVFPDGQTMLVDGGGFPVFKGSTARRMDIGEQVVSPYLWQRGIRHIDIVALTHAHEDHSQGLNAVVRNFRPKQLWTGAISGSNASGLLTEARRSGARIVHPQAGYAQRFGGATVRVLAPSVGYVPSNTAKNNDSLVMEIVYGQRRFVLTGDAERVVEWELVAGGTLGQVDVLKVGHHGSKSSTTPELMQATKPRFAMISVGDGNLYGHPHPDVLSRLRDAHTQVFRTDRNGLTRFLTDGNRLFAETHSLGWLRD